MRLVALAEDREYQDTCFHCHALYAYTKGDIKIRTMEVHDLNWLGWMKKSTHTIRDKYVECPNCHARNYLIK